MVVLFVKQGLHDGAEVTLPVDTEGGVEEMAVVWLVDIGGRGFCKHFREVYCT